MSHRKLGRKKKKKRTKNDQTKGQKLRIVLSFESCDVIPIPCSEVNSFSTNGRVTCCADSRDWDYHNHNSCDVIPVPCFSVNPFLHNYGQKLRIVLTVETDYHNHSSCDVIPVPCSSVNPFSTNGRVTCCADSRDWDYHNHSGCDVIPVPCSSVNPLRRCSALDCRPKCHCCLDWLSSFRTRLTVCW